MEEKGGEGRGYSLQTHCVLRHTQLKLAHLTATQSLREDKNTITVEIQWISLTSLGIPPQVVQMPEAIITHLLATSEMPSALTWPPLESVCRPVAQHPFKFTLLQHMPLT